MLVCVHGLVSVQSPDQMLVLSFSRVPIISSSSFLGEARKGKKNFASESSQFEVVNEVYL